MKKLFKKYFWRSIRISLISTLICSIILGSAFITLGAERIVPKESSKQITVDLSCKDSPNGTSSITAAITNESLNTVKTSLFGANDSWIDDGYGLWDAEKNEPYSVMLNKVRASGIYHLRYPGGTEGDYVHWYDIVGDVSERTPQLDVFSKDFPTYSKENGTLFQVTFGVDELYELCEKAGIKATIQLNAGTGSPKEAADYIAYIKKNGWLKLTDSFAIGNEVCLPLENLESIKVQKTPLEYINFCEELFDILGEDVVSDKDIQLGIIGMPASHPLSGNKNWDRQVIDALKGKIDFIDVHIGYAYYYNKNGESAEDCMKCFLAAGSWVKSLLEEEKATIAEYGGEHADDISIQICEWGPVGGSYPNSLGASLFVSDVLNVMLEEPKVSAADYLPLLNHYAAGNLIGANTYAAVTGGDEYYWNNCASYVYKWYSDLVGSDVLDVDISGCDTFSSVPVGELPAIENVDEGDVNVYYDESTGKGSMFILNRSLDKNLSYIINLPTDKAVISDITELWSEDPTKGNSWQEPNKVVPVSYEADKSEFGTLKITTKPASLVKVEFQADDIELYIPIKNTENKPDGNKTDGNSDRTEPIGKNPGSENKSGDKTQEQNPGAEQEPNHNPVKNTIKRIRNYVADNLPVLLMIIVVEALTMFLLAELMFVLLHVIKRKRQRNLAM